ncbi:ABC transporter ATP-binding protein [Microbacterium sp. cx-55]|uniref:sulfate/molybdate ABC transporter ATP-binding protein n=1 Tax=Microbacterium sp. cx-55 TaxID=2875948 RepID=UPI001CC02569|nr:ABC transporter ATP-binding protein [Microbacterium sp. cx-55]MBZ4487962.1 ABC transporter ATP-binding protein [Microbacterium sp. cx-55]UGB34628.1 ABC transporter ATP-binding protein [Microbacterium sp. cx-55]
MSETLDADVTVDYPSGFTLSARLVAASGTTVAVMGPSGAGKSTLLAAIAGLVALDAGHVRLGERTLSDGRMRIAAARRGTVLLGQDPRLFPHLSARENVAFGPRAAGVAVAEARRTADELLARVGLAEAGDRRPAALSGGQQQRVAVARALAASPGLILLDEPFTSLDPVTASGIRTMLSAQLADRTCIIVTHDAVDAVALADRVAVVEDGRITQSGRVRDVLRAPSTAFVASLAGLNRVVGVSAGGACRVGDVAFAGDRGARVPDGQSVAAVFRPADARIVPGNVHGSGTSRTTTWHAVVARLEQTVGGVRVHTVAAGGSIQVAVDVATDELADAGLVPGVEIVVQVPATTVRLLPV